MKRCLKCSSCRVSGPHYRQEEDGSEYLAYICRCGYIRRESTHETWQNNRRSWDLSEAINQFAELWRRMPENLPSFVELREPPKLLESQ
jgi:hypothetical protein